MSQSETIFSPEGLLEIPAGHVNVKATTNEGMGFVGSGEGIAAYAMVLLVPRTPSTHSQ